MTLFSSANITERLIRISAPGNVCAFLALGNEKAALIDTGFGYGSLKEYTGTLTDKPLTVILTHGHYDHVGGAGEFDKVYIPEEDAALALEHGKKQCRAAGLAGFGIMPEESEMTPDLKREQLITMKDGQEFDLGGYTVRLLSMPGHTEGMMCPLFAEDRIILFGDACNSFTFMQLEHALTIEEYRDHLIEFRRKYADLYDTPVYSHPHNFGDKTILDEMILLCEEVMRPEFKGIDLGEMLGPGILAAKAFDASTRNIDGTAANMTFRAENIRKQ